MVAAADSGAPIVFSSEIWAVVVSVALLVPVLVFAVLLFCCYVVSACCKDVAFQWGFACELFVVAMIGCIIGFLSGISLEPVTVTLISSLFALVSAAAAIVMKPADRSFVSARVTAPLGLFFFAAFLQYCVGLVYVAPLKDQEFCKTLFVEEGANEAVLDRFEWLCRDQFFEYYIGKAMGF